MNRRITLPLICLLLILVTSCSVKPINRFARPHESPRLAVISAFEPELKALLNNTTIIDTSVINGRTFYIGQLAGNEVVLVMSGISMVNAAMITQTLLDHFAIDHIVFSGIAGGVNPALNIGDVVIPAQWGEYQKQVYARELEDGWDLGHHDREFPNFGMIFPQKTAVTQKGGTADQETRFFWFQVDPTMLTVARNAAGNVALEKCTEDGQCLASSPKVIVGGNGVSGSTFVDNAGYRAWTWDTFQANALDMESAAVAHVAYVNKVPFIAFRSLSDLAGGGPGANEMATFFQLASNNSAAVVTAFLQAWSSR